MSDYVLTVPQRHHAYSLPGPVYSEAENALRQLKDSTFGDAHKSCFIPTLRHFQKGGAAVEICGRDALKIVGFKGDLPNIPECCRLETAKAPVLAVA